MSCCGVTKNSSQAQPAFASFPLSSFLSDFFGDPRVVGFRAAEPRASATSGSLAVDVLEDEASLIVRASLPGFRKEEVDIQVHEGVLSIRAQRAEEATSGAESYLRRERRSGSVGRSFTLPDTVSGQDVKAELKDGVLTLRLGKTPKEQPRKVQIA